MPRNFGSEVVDTYTSYALKDIENCFHAANFWKVQPFKWDKNNGAPSDIKKAELAYVTWLLNFAISLAFALFSFLVFAASITQEGWETSTQVHLGISFPVYWLALVVVHLSATLIGDDIVKIVPQAKLFLLANGSLLEDKPGDHIRTQTACSTLPPPVSSSAASTSTADCIGHIDAPDDCSNHSLHRNLPAKSAFTVSSQEQFQSKGPREPKPDTKRTSENQNKEKNFNDTNSTRPSECKPSGPLEDGSTHQQAVLYLARSLYWFLRLRRIGIYANLLLLYLYDLVHPDAPELMTSLVATQSAGLYRTAAIVCIQALYAWYFIAVAHGVMLDGSVLYSSTFWTLAFIESQRSMLKCGDSLRKQMAAYRGVLLFVDRLNRLASYFVPVCKAVIGTTSVCALYGVARLSGIFQWFCGVYGVDTMVMMCIMLFVLADIQEKASEWYKDMERELIARGNNLWLRKKLKSLRPVRCSVGGMYYVDKMLIFTVIDVILQNAIAVFVMGD